MVMDTNQTVFYELLVNLPFLEYIAAIHGNSFMRALTPPMDLMYLCGSSESRACHLQLAERAY
ncbi:hypothetical protein KIN20_021183 [Parelaphostrongylus tenuis]|uniref:Uncharacterized protein n=1 Tax=Parelaphostrongylus tenuis TaxID=148309 RepID=A0AAD5MNJ4_PARTN|nr:hypothetical protein KIN20_021183 [Parelaphostrongylus tenuis]